MTITMGALPDRITDPLGRGLHIGGSWKTAPGGWDVVVQCCPGAPVPPALRTHRFPFNDGRHVPVTTVDAAASVVVEEIRAGRRVLVLCAWGLNRSGLVCGLALRRLNNWDADRVITHMRERRCEGVLSNRAFVDYLQGA